MENLIKIQSELKAPKNQNNSFWNYNYRSCEDILEAVKPLLLTHCCVLTISDEMVQVWSRIYVKATATIKCGDLQESVTAFAREAETKKWMDDSQITGSSSSYARKYALNWLFLIDDTKDADTMDNTRNPKTTDEKDYVKLIREFVSKNIPTGLNADQAKIEANEFVSNKIWAYFSFDNLTKENAKDIYFKLTK